MSDPTPPEDQSSDAPSAPPGFANYAAYEPPTAAAPPPAQASRPAAGAPKRRSLLPIVLVVVLLVAVAVGAFVWLSGDDSSSDDQAAKGTPGAAVVAWASRMADDDHAGACKLLAADSRAVIEANGPTCADALATMDPDGIYDDGDQTEVVKTVVDGDRARVTVRYGGDGAPQEVLVVKEGGAWKASPFGDPASSSDEPAAGAPKEDVGDASTAGCQAEIAVAQTAVDAYSTLNGEPPASAQVLVDEGFLRELPERVEIRDGVATGTGPCA